jgi:hypothetical protein
VLESVHIRELAHVRPAGYCHSVRPFASLASSRGRAALPSSGNPAPVLSSAGAVSRPSGPGGLVLGFRHGFEAHRHESVLSRVSCFGRSLPLLFGVFLQG